MIQSMTGFGKATAEIANKKVTVEIKSLNSKQLDLMSKVNALYREREMEFRQMLQRELQRGKVDFSVSVELHASEQTPQINTEVVKAYKQQIDGLYKELNLAQPGLAGDSSALMLQLLLRMPETITMQTQTIEQEELNEVTEVVKLAIENIVEFRKQEGAGLEKFFTGKLDNIAALLAEVPQYERARIDKIKARLEDNLKEIDDKIKFDPNRLEQELIFYIEKLDISEEKQRLTNHIKYFREVMANEHGQGKKLGFIAQEMGREINTLGSKSNHSEMQIIVVKMKDELEQIKEQVLNVL